jgi:hypothetical protein
MPFFRDGVSVFSNQSSYTLYTTPACTINVPSLICSLPFESKTQDSVHSCRQPEKSAEGARHILDTPSSRAQQTNRSVPVHPLLTIALPLTVQATI